MAGALVLILVGFLISIEAFREIRVPFTSIVLRAGRQERVAMPADGDEAPIGTAAPDHAPG